MVMRLQYLLVPIPAFVIFFTAIVSPDMQSGAISAFAVLGALAAVVVTGVSRLPHRWALIAFFFLVAMSVLSLFNTGISLHALFGTTMEWGTVASLVLFLIAFALGSVSVPSAKEATRWSIEITGVLAALPSALVLLGVLPLSVLQGPGMSLSFVCCAAALIAALRADTSRGGLRMIHILLGALSFAGFVALFSREAAFVALFAAVCVLVLRLSRAIHSYALGAFLLGMLVLLFIGTRVPLLPLPSDGHPTLETTRMIIGPQYLDHPRNVFLGSGPHTFQYAWNLYRPAAVNASDFWMLTPKYSVSALATIAIEYGLLTMLGFIALFLFAFNSARRHAEDLALPAAGGFLFASSFVFPLAVPLILLAGMLLGMSADHPAVASTSRERAVAQMFWIVLTILGIGLSFVAIRQIAASRSDARGLAQLTSRNENAAIMTFDDAVHLWPASEYKDEAALAHMRHGYLEMTSGAAAQGNGDIVVAVRLAESAASADPADFNRWMFNASFYVELARHGDTKSFDTAAVALTRAQMLAPTRPDVYLALAQISLVKGDHAQAIAQLNQALTLKPDYKDAHVLLSSLQAP